MLCDSRCKLEEPLRKIATDVDTPKTSLFKIGTNDNYSFSPPQNLKREGCSSFDLHDYNVNVVNKLKGGLLKGKTLFCMRGLSLSDI